MVTVSVKKEALGFKGRICVYEGTRYLWDEVSPIVRLTQLDAVIDAHQMAADLAKETASQ